MGCTTSRYAKKDDSLAHEETRIDEIENVPEEVLAGISECAQTPVFGSATPGFGEAEERIHRSSNTRIFAN